MCRFIDWLEDTDEIKDNATVWDASIGDRKRDKICTKADFVGNTDAGGDWRLTFKPKLQYVLAVVDDDDLDNGIVAISTELSFMSRSVIINSGTEGIEYRLYFIGMVCQRVVDWLASSHRIRDPCGS